MHTYETCYRFKNIDVLIIKLLRSANFFRILFFETRWNTRNCKLYNVL